MISRTPTANATGVVASATPVRINSITVRQRSAVAPRLYLQLIDRASATIGTHAPADVVSIPAGRTEHQSVNKKVEYSGTNGGLQFGTGLVYAVTTDINGSTNPNAGDEPEVIIDFEPYT